MKPRKTEEVPQRSVPPILNRCSLQSLLSAWISIDPPVYMIIAAHVARVFERSKRVNSGRLPLTPFAKPHSVRGFSSRARQKNQRIHNLPFLVLSIWNGVKQTVFQIVLGHGNDVAIAEKDVEHAVMAERIVRLGGRIVEWRPGSARRLHARIGTAGRAGMVPYDHDIRAAVAVDDVREPFAVRPSSYVIHAIAYLVGLSERRTAGDIVE